MKNYKHCILVCFLLAGLLITNSYAQENEKLAQTGFQFLSVVSDARGSSMAEAMTSLEAGSSSLFFNPAGMAEMHGFLDVSASINMWIADIKHNTFSLAFKPFDGTYGVFGLSAQFINYGEFFGTRVNRANPNGYEDTGIFELNAMALGVGYAKQLTDQFSIGGHVKFVHQDLGESTITVITASENGTDTTAGRTTNELNPLVFDFGTQFKPGFKSLVFGMSVRNFSTEVKYAEEGFEAPLVFNLGISLDVLDLFPQTSFDQSLFLAVDATHHRDHPEQVKIGMEYTFNKIFSLRAGYITSNDEDDISYGIGVQQFGFAFDYSYTPFGVFDKVQRFTARFNF